MHADTHVVFFFFSYNPLPDDKLEAHLNILHYLDLR